MDSGPSRSMARGEPAPVAITGATGSVGGEVVRRMGELGAPVRAAVRRPASWTGAGQPVAFDFEATSTYVEAFSGCRALFLVRPPALSDVKRSVIPALDAAERGGVRHVVLLSLLGADKNRLVPHRAIEDHLRASGMTWTFLRAGFFMQNLTTTHRGDIRDHSEIIVPAGGGRTSFIDVRDIAAVAALTLTEAGHENRAYDLTGAEALTYGEAAEILSDVLGRTIDYRRPGLVRFIRHMRRQGHPLPYVLVMSGIYATTRLGLAGRVTDDVERLLGRPPTSFRRFAEDHRACWAEKA